VSQRRLVIKVGLIVWNQCDELLTINSNGRRVTLTRVTAFCARAAAEGFDGSLAIPRISNWELSARSSRMVLMTQPP
jgi:hypothetical protein